MASKNKLLLISVEGEEDPLSIPAPDSYSELLELVATQCRVDQAQVVIERKKGVCSNYILSDISYYLCLQTDQELTFHVTILQRSTFLNDGYYTGDLQEELPHGYGNMYYHNCDSYRGEWVNGHYHGAGGLSRKAQSLLIEGEFYHGLPDGHAIELSANGTTYDGNFTEGTKNGRGKTILSDGTLFQGQYVDGTLVGQGLMIVADGTKYEGDLTDHIPTGNGRITYTDGSEYQGEVRKGLRHGQGVFRNKSGWVLQGRFESNAAWGEGVLTTKEGKKIVGRWENDEMVEVQHGIGLLNYRLSTLK